MLAWCSISETHDLVAGLQRAPRPAATRFTASVPPLVKTISFGVGAMNAATFAGGLVGVGGLVGEGVQAAVHVGVGVLHRPAHGVDHRPRLLAEAALSR
jgi:hypothetical protein